MSHSRIFLQQPLTPSRRACKITPNCAFESLSVSLKLADVTVLELQQFFLLVNVRMGRRAQGKK